MKETNCLEPKKKRRRKKKKVNYFDENTQDAIVRFQNEEFLEKKKEIFLSDIQPAFAKLIENLIFVYKFHSLGSIDVLKNDCLSFLFEVIGKYDVTKGHKAFSYFNVVARNWFSQKAKQFKKKNRSDIQFDQILLNKLEKSENNAIVFSYEGAILDKEYLSLLKDEIKVWRTKFDKSQEKKVLEAIILLIENPDLVDIYNKKSIYLNMREITGLNTKQIVTNLSKFKKKYEGFKKKYQGGEI